MNAPQLRMQHGVSPSLHVLAHPSAAANASWRRTAPRILQSGAYFCKPVLILTFMLIALLPRLAHAQNEPLQPVSAMPMFGQFCMAEGGISLHDAPYTGSFTVDVPGTPERAYWFWTGRSRTAPFAGDNTIVINHNNRGDVTFTAVRERSSFDKEFMWHTYGYTDTLLSHVETGLNTYAVSGLSINNANRENHGVGVLVIYRAEDCPYTRINGWYGLDSFRFRNPVAPFGPDSEMVCDTFAPADTPRDLTYHLVVGGVANPNRGNSIWYITGNGSPPTNITPDPNNVAYPGAIEVADPLNGYPGREWDFNSGIIQIPANHSYLCFQIESPEDDDGVSAVWAGLATAMDAPPAIEIRKTPDQQSVTVGAPVTFTIQVTNTGAITLHNVAVTDELTPACDANLGILSPGESQAYSCTLDTVPADFVNVAVVTGEPPDGPTVSDEDDAVVTVTAVDDVSAALGDTVWLDENNDGIQNDQEPGLAGVTVRLFDEFGTEVAATKTDAHGKYAFTDLAGGTYEVRFELPDPRFVFSPSHVGDDDAADSDADEATGRTGPISLSPGQIDNRWDAGIYGVPDLHIQKSDNGAVGQPGAAIRYTLVYSNTGPVDARGVVITEVVPPHTTFDPDSSSPGWVCANGSTAAGTPCSYVIGTLPADTSGEVAVVFVVHIDSAIPTEVTTIFNQVLLNADNIGPEGESNIAHESTPLAPTALAETEEPESDFLEERIFVPLISHAHGF